MKTVSNWNKSKNKINIFMKISTSGSFKSLIMVLTPNIF